METTQQPVERRMQTSCGEARFTRGMPSTEKRMGDMKTVNE
ncbi:hypothetical protein [Paenibacillus sp. TY11]